MPGHGRQQIVCQGVEHIKKNNGHTIDWNLAVFLNKEKHRREKNKKGAFYQCTKSDNGVQPGKGYEFGKMFFSGPNSERFQCKKCFEILLFMIWTELTIVIPSVKKFIYNILVFIF